VDATHAGSGINDHLRAVLLKKGKDSSAVA
jgi:hypothetical protein